VDLTDKSPEPTERVVDVPLEQVPESSPAAPLNVQSNEPVTINNADFMALQTELLNLRQQQYDAAELKKKHETLINKLRNNNKRLFTDNQTLAGALRDMKHTLDLIRNRSNGLLGNKVDAEIIGLKEKNKELTGTVKALRERLEAKEREATSLATEKEQLLVDNQNLAMHSRAMVVNESAEKTVTEEADERGKELEQQYVQNKFVATIARKDQQIMDLQADMHRVVTRLGQKEQEVAKLRETMHKTLRHSEMYQTLKLRESHILLYQKRVKEQKAMLEKQYAKIGQLSKQLASATEHVKALQEGRPFPAPRKTSIPTAAPVATPVAAPVSRSARSQSHGPVTAKKTALR
jgi:hypothetical protein